MRKFILIGLLLIVLGSFFRIDARLDEQVLDTQNAQAELVFNYIVTNNQTGKRELSDSVSKTMSQEYLEKTGMGKFLESVASNSEDTLSRDLTEMYNKYTHNSDVVRYKMYSARTLELAGVAFIIFSLFYIKFNRKRNSRFKLHLCDSSSGLHIISSKNKPILIEPDNNILSKDNSVIPLSDYRGDIMLDNSVIGVYDYMGNNEYIIEGRRKYMNQCVQSLRRFVIDESWVEGRLILTPDKEWYYNDEYTAFIVPKESIDNFKSSNNTINHLGVTVAKFMQDTEYSFKVTTVRKFVKFVMPVIISNTEIV